MINNCLEIDKTKRKEINVIVENLNQVLFDYSMIKEGKKPTCRLGGQCDVLDDEIHWNQYVHPDLCPFGLKCQQISNPIHSFSFIHPKQTTMTFQDIKKEDLNNMEIWKYFFTSKEDLEKFKKEKMTMRDFIFVEESDLSIVMSNLNYRTKSTLKQLWHFFNSSNVTFHKNQESELKLEIGHPLLFDVPFSSTHYHLSNNNQRVDFKCSSVHVNPIYEDFHHYPVARMPYIFNKRFMVQFQMSAYGWFGVGTKNLANDGFPGYTAEGFAISTKGILFHNGYNVGTTNMNYSNALVTLICDPSISLLHVVVGNQRHDYWPSNSPNTFPKEVYFFISVTTNGSVQLISLEE
jgi:hypothetical protein